MSKVAIKGNASGTGTFTLEAPNSNTDRTLVLPDEAGTVVTTGSYVAGITEADQWRITTNNTKNNAEIINTGWERNDVNFQLIGTGVSESSGIFSFPNTGIWLVKAFTSVATNTTDGFAGFRMEITLNNGSTWDGRAEGYSDSPGGGNYASVYCEAIIDVTDVSNQKIRLLTILAGGATGTYEAETDGNRTCITFIKLGET